jgi:hypothetical protein
VDKLLPSAVPISRSSRRAIKQVAMPRNGRRESERGGIERINVGILRTGREFDEITGESREEVGIRFLILVRAPHGEMAVPPVHVRVIASTDGTIRAQR